ncbi:MAG: DUF4390 domain-containing protein [Betaproteobacteria bacterium]
MPKLARPALLPPSPRRRAALRMLAVVSLAAVIGSAHADVVPVKSAELRLAEGDLQLFADFDLALTPSLEEALEKGIPLYFTIEFELSRTRWYWTDEKLAQWSITYRVSYNALTRQYRVSTGPLGQHFESLDEVQRFVSRVSARPVARAESLTRGVRYEAAVRFKLDVNQLPKPFQVNALASREWQLASDWHRWTFVP